MSTFGPKGQHWLKAFHILFSCLWAGSCFALIGMQTGLATTHGEALWGMDIAKKYVDDFILIPGAIGSFLTGLLLSTCTSWGFFKYTWIIIKWTLTLACILFGTFWLGPWLNAMPGISEIQGILALSNPLYLKLKGMHTTGAVTQTFFLTLIVFLSVLKPWGRFRRANHI